jgi:hypothetical protein
MLVKAYLPCHVDVDIDVYLGAGEEERTELGK